MRLFAGIPLPPHVQQRFANLRLRLAAPNDGLRWSEPEQWHLTLQFYGEVDASRTDCLIGSLRQLTPQPVLLSCDSLGLFRPKGILTAEIAPTDSLRALHAVIAERSQNCGVLPESRPFHPHLTLARSRNKVGMRTLQWLSTPALPGFGPAVSWVPEAWYVYQSELLPSGAQYTAIARFPLESIA